MKEYLRIRFEKGKNHLSYFFLNFDKKNPYELISTDEYETRVENPIIAKKIFEKIGLIFKIKVEKERKYFDCENFMVTLDKVKGLGSFMEVEAKKIIKNEKNTKNLCEKFLKDLKIEYKYNPEKGGGYPRMLYLKKYKKIIF